MFLHLTHFAEISSQANRMEKERKCTAQAGAELHRMSKYFILKCIITFYSVMGTVIQIRNCSEIILTNVHSKINSGNVLSDNRERHIASVIFFFK